MQTVTFKTGDPRFVTCDACDGYGAIVYRVTVYEPGCAFAHDDTEEHSCSWCKGEGVIEVETFPVDLEDA